MAFAHQYTHAGTAAPLSASQVMLTTKSSHSPTSPPGLDHARTLMQESGLPLLHFLPRLNGLTPESVFGQGQLTPTSLGIEPSAFYPMASPAGHLPGTPEQWKGLPGQAPVVYPFDPMLAVHPYAPFYGGLDLNNAARRKNATRETTSALKAWLYEHRKNPYPTKGEKIMLAIITKMTLTQVSTWFANARRRLKKESKSWNGKDRDLDDSDIEADGVEGANHSQENSLITSFSFNDDDDDDEDIDIKVTSDLSDISDAEDEHSNEKSSETNYRLSAPSDLSSSSINCRLSPSSSTSIRDKTRTNSDNARGTQTDSTSSQNNSGSSISAVPRPRIWSIEEIMNKDSPKTTPRHQTSTISFCHNVKGTMQDSQTDKQDSNKFVIDGIQSNSSCTKTQQENSAPCESGRPS